MTNPIESFEALLASGQDNEMLRYTLGNAYFTQKQYTKAAEHLRAALKHKPDYSAAWKVLGRVLAEQEQWHDALAAFDAGLAVAESNGDKQTAKEMTVFRRRVVKQIETE